MIFSNEASLPTPPPEREEGLEYLAKPIPPDVEEWLMEFERNDPEGARGHRLARMYSWTWTELMRFRQSGEMPARMDVNPTELDAMLEANQTATEQASEHRAPSEPSLGEDPQIQAYLKLKGFTPLIEWEQLDQEWEQLSSEKGIEEPIRKEVAQTLHQLISGIIESCSQYAAVLRAHGRVRSSDRDTAVENSTLGETRRRSHNALIDRVTVISRYTQTTLPQKYGVKFPRSIFDPAVLTIRDRVAHWALLTDYFIQHRDLSLRRDLA